MEEEVEPLAVSPGHSLGIMSLGASLQGVLSAIKLQSKLFTAIEIHYSQSSPLDTPIIVNLPKNALRLRFDGKEQRLRCIELLDFNKLKIAYKGTQLGRHEEGAGPLSAPSFRRIYQIFGAAFPGEYVPPRHGEYTGTYILSWPGIAFSFSMQHSAWSPSKDHVSLLGSQAAGPASHMILFEGKTWPGACPELFVYEPSLSRNLNAAHRPKDIFPPDIDTASIVLDGRLELHRGSLAPAFSVVLNRTTPQDLISELGPPDAMHKRDATAMSTEQQSHKRSDSTSKPSNTRRGHPGSTPSSYSSTATDTYETDFDSDIRDDDPLERANRETFWCYFDHGMDILVAPATIDSQSKSQLASTRADLVVTKVVIHGNIPGTYAFNRHRRLRWRLPLTASTLHSEMSFESELRTALLKHFKGAMPESEMARGKVINRSWGSSPTDTAFFLPDAGEELIEGSGSEQWLGNTRLYHFPGLSFEVTESGFVTAVTVG